MRLPGGEKFFGLQHFGALHVTDFGCDVFDATADNAQRRKECGMAVTRDHLGRNWLGLEAQLGADMLFDPRINIGKCPDRTGNCACGDFIAGNAQTAKVAIHFRVESGKCQTHRSGLGVNAVRPPYAHSVLVLDGTALEGRKQNLHIRDK